MCGVQSGEFVCGYYGFVLKSQQCAADHFTPVLINKSTCMYSHDTVASFFFHSMHRPPSPPPNTATTQKEAYRHTFQGRMQDFF